MKHMLWPTVLVGLVLVVVCLVDVTSGASLNCAPCTNTTCVPPPPACEVGQRICSCCLECRVEKGGVCDAYGPECRSDLVCFTSLGVFLGRPPLSSVSAIGTCIRYEDVPT